MEYVPGSAYMAEKKTFEWHLVRFDSDSIQVRLIFDDPGIVSMNNEDQMKVVFNNTSFFMKPLSDTKKPVPNGLPLFTPIPPQDGDLLSEEAKENTITSAKSVVLTNIILSFLFKNSMQVLFGSIISLQILAHLPLSNV